MNSFDFLKKVPLSHLAKHSLVCGHSARFWDSQKKGKSAFEGDVERMRENGQKMYNKENMDENKRH